MTNLLFRIFLGKNPDPSKPATREKFGVLAGGVGIGVNLLLSLMKLLLGIFSGSVAITADALNNLSDAGASIMTLVSFRIAAKPADRDHPFGHARMEYICSMIVSFLILLVGGELLISSFKTLVGITPPEGTNVTLITVILLSATILIKLWLALFYTSVGRKIDSVAMRASASDSLSDCVSTGAVLVCSVVMMIFPALVWLDAAVGLCVALLILYAGVKILNETKNSLLGEAPVEETVEAIKAIVRRHPEALGIHDMMVHNYGPNRFIASLHVEVDGSADVFMLHDVIDNIEKEIHGELGILCTVHMDPIVTNDETVSELRDFVLATVRSVCDDLTVHDFRTVVGATHTNLIFDVILPFESKMSPAEVTDAISAKVLEERPNHFCVITVDRG